jgi:hypothetical protein
LGEPAKLALNDMMGGRRCGETEQGIKAGKRELFK